MKRLAPYILLALLVGTSFACQAANRLIFGETPTPVPTQTPRPTRTPTPHPTVTPTPDNCPSGNCINSCVTKLNSVVLVHPPKEQGGKHVFKDNEKYTLSTYQIDGNDISDPVLGKNIPASIQPYRDNQTAQKEAWDYFAAIIPLEQRNFLAHYVVFTDGKDNILASVSQSDKDSNEWDLSVDIIDTSSPRELTFTLIHEFGHLLTLNPDQVPPSQAIFDHPQSDSVFEKEKKACPNYFPGEGCSKAKSYINLFEKRFWGKIYDEWAKIDNIDDEESYYNSLERFYKKYRDQFVTDYAPTSPEEDIAETWSYFILKPKPADQTIADKKVLFFYEFPELVKLREQIARNLCNQLEK